MEIVNVNAVNIESGLIVHQVNCQGVMGAGLAGSLAKKYPALKEEYVAYCEGKTAKQLLGKVQFVEVTDGLTIANVFGQDTYGRTGQHTNMKALEAGLRRILKRISLKKNADLNCYIPAKIGAGLGGADESEVAELLSTVFADVDNVIFFDNKKKATSSTKKKDIPAPVEDKTDFIVIIAGTRGFDDYKLLKTKCDKILTKVSQTRNVIIRSGGAKGADLLGEKYAKERGFTLQQFIPEWRPNGVYDRAAGHKRNRQMADGDKGRPVPANALIAFWDSESPGTRGMIEYAENKDLRVRVIEYTHYE